MPRLGFETTIPVFERAKTVRPRGHCDRQAPKDYWEKIEQIRKQKTEMKKPRK
jgi:hypothetical protein